MTDAKRASNLLIYVLVFFSGYYLARAKQKVKQVIAEIAEGIR